MTALARYIRLEALGLWREDPEAPPREVVVAFGNSTLVLKDLAENPLGHWALAGVAPVGRDGAATIFAMTPDGDETLAISDAEMIAAIAAVAHPTGNLRPPPDRVGRRRLPLGPLLLLGAVAAAAFAAPRLMQADAARLLPPDRAAMLGDRMLIVLIERQGPLCYDPAGQEALAALAARVDAAAPPHLRVIELGDVPVAALPGGTVLIDRALPAAVPAETLAGWVALALGRDSVASLLAHAGATADLRYFVTGDFTDAALARAAAATLVAPEADEVPGALARLSAANLDSRPFSEALAGAGLPHGMPRPVDAAVPPLSDRDRAALAKVCG